MKIDRFKIIDCHAHVIEHLAGFGYRGEMRAIGNGKGRFVTGEVVDLFVSGYGDKGFTAERLIEEMDTCGVQKAILLQGSFYGFQNEYTFESQEKYTGRLYGAGTLDPYCIEAKRILRRLVEDFKFRAIKLEMSNFTGFVGYHPDFKLDGKVMEPLLDYAVEKGTVIIIDPGSFNAGAPGFQVNELKKIAKAYKSIIFVLEHLFAPPPDCDNEVRKNIKIFEDLKNIYFSLASIPYNTFPETYPFASACRYMKILKESVGAERIMWGSDIPGTVTRAPYKHLIKFVYSSGVFNDKELQQVYAGTAEKVYGLRKQS